MPRAEGVLAEETPHRASPDVGAWTSSMRVVQCRSGAEDGQPGAASVMDMCIPQTKPYRVERQVVVSETSTDFARVQLQRTADESEVIVKLEAVGWLEWQLALYGMYRTDRRHKYLRDTCSCGQPFTHEPTECCAGRVCRWFFGLSVWSIVMCVLATANACDLVRVQVDDAHRFHFTDFWDKDDKLEMYDTFPDEFTDRLFDKKYHQSCCNDGGKNNRGHVAGAHCLIPSCLDLFASIPDWVQLRRDKVPRDDPRWHVSPGPNQTHVADNGVLAWDCEDADAVVQESCPVDFSESDIYSDTLCCEAQCDGCGKTTDHFRTTCEIAKWEWQTFPDDPDFEHHGYNCCGPRNHGRLPTVSHWEEPAVVATAVCQATINTTTRDIKVISFPQMCTPGFYCNTIAEQNELNGMNLATGVAWVALAVLLLLNHLLVLKIATPGGSGRRTHPLTDAIDPFTWMAVAMDVARDVDRPTPLGLQEAQNRLEMRQPAQDGSTNPSAAPAAAGGERDVEQALLAGPPVENSGGQRLLQRASAIRDSVQNFLRKRQQALAQSGNQVISNAAQSAALWAWLPIVFLSIWWCCMPLESLGGKSGLQYVVNDETDWRKRAEWQDVIRPPIFVLLSYPSLVTTALLLRVVCAIHKHHAAEIIESIQVDGGSSRRPRTVDELHSQFVTLRDGLINTGKRWQWLLLVQILIFIALATIPFCQFWRDHIGLSKANGGDTWLDELNELVMVLAQFCPLALCVRSIMDINSTLDDVPATLAQRKLLTVVERDAFHTSYEGLQLGIYIFGVRLTTSRLVRGVATVSALLVFSKFKDLFFNMRD